MQPQPEPRTIHLAAGSPPVELVLHEDGSVTWRVPLRSLSDDALERERRAVESTATGPGTFRELGVACGKLADVREEQARRRG